MGDLKDYYRRIYGFNTFNRREWVTQQAKLLPNGSRVLDVGAGVGQYRTLFTHCEYYAQDFGQEIATVGKYTKLDYVCDITAMPIEDGSFDAVLCTEVLEHVPEPAEALREMGRIVRSGGRLLLTAPLGSLLHQEPYHFYGGYTPHWYRRVLGNCHFDIESIERNQGFFSLFGQEAQRFRSYLHPTHTRKISVALCVVLTPLWVLSWPISYALPLLGNWLDRLDLENTATVGYHVIAVKRQTVDSADDLSRD
jgi:SAM-dependent methyltransferase